MFYRHLTSVLLVIMAAVLWGCSESPAPPAHNRNYVGSDGRFVGHLKPEPGPPQGPNGKTIRAHDPVIWIVEAGNVSQPEYEHDVQAFRIDFDERIPLSEENLPYALMTEQTQQVVVHRGLPPTPFSHPEINDGELCAPIYRCASLDCPRVQEIENFALFPAANETEAGCPFCGNKEVQPFVMPQHVHMRAHMAK